MTKLPASIFGAVGLATLLALPTAAQEAIKVGLILPKTGPFASTGRQIEAGVRLYQEMNGTTVCNGRPVELIVRDDTGVAPDMTRRLAQELVINDDVDVLAGFGLTPLAIATAPVATEAKKPMILMSAATSFIPSLSPFIVRTSFTMGQLTWPIAEWAAKNNIKRVVTLVTDYAPGLDGEKNFIARFTENGGEVVESLRAPLTSADYAPFMQRVLDAKPDALFVFVPSGEGANVLKQFVERGLPAAGIKLIGTGDVLDDDLMPNMPKEVIGAITAFNYSAAHDSPENKAYVEAYKKANPGNRPNMMSVHGFDGMHVIYEALNKTSCDGDGEKLVEAMKGLAWESPRGPVSIDPELRDIVQNIYIREAKEVDGELWNVEFDTVEAVKDPGAAGQR